VLYNSQQIAKSKTKMKRSLLVEQKNEHKLLSVTPEFSPIKRGKLPKPLNAIGGPRVQGTQLLPISEKHSAWFMWKDGETLEQRSFYGYLFSHVGHARNLYPLCELHWHPSHKELHIKTPCNSESDYTGRGLPGAKELNLNRDQRRFDPRIDQHRLRLIEIFCDVCGIQFGTGPLL